MQRLIYILLTITTLIIAQVAQCQTAPAIEWAKNYGGSNGDAGFCIKQTNDSGYVILGITLSNDSDVTTQKGNGDVWIVKLNNKGQIQWQKTYGGSSSDNPSSLSETIDGGYIFCARTVSTDGDIIGQHGAGDYWIVKIDSVGNKQWAKCYGGTGDDIPSHIIQTYNKGYIVAGLSVSTDFDVIGNHTLSNFLTPDAWILKLDSIGNIEWSQCYGGTDDDRASSIVQTKDSGYIFCGNTFSTNGDVTGKHLNSDVWLVKIDKDGYLISQKCLGGSGYENCEAGNNVLLNEDESIVIGATTNSTDGDVTTNHGMYDFWVIKIDNSGNIIWQNTYGGSQDELLVGVAKTAENGYTVIGSTISNDGDVTGNNGNIDYWLLKLDSNGTKQWQKCLGGSNIDMGYSIQQCKDDQYICVGYTSSANDDVTVNYGNEDVWVVKLKTDSLLPLRFIKYFLSASFTNTKQSVENIWTTANEVNVSHFNIERSFNGKDFKVVGKVKANNKVSNEYRFTDNSLLLTINERLYYKIVAIDYDGRKIYSEIKAIDCKQLTNNEILMYPNPASSAAYIATQNIKEIRLIDALGRVYINKKIDNTNNTGYYYLPLNYIANGTYMVQAIDTEGVVRTGKLVVAKCADL